MKKRIDVYLFEKGFAPSREKARLYVMAGAVHMNGVLCSKPSSIVPEGAEVTVKQSEEFVSRGGRKLQKAVNSFGIMLDGLNAVDIGASTGGFTDCMLRSGAAFVYAVDVGYGQLAWRLRQDERVRVMERQNARYLTRDMFDKPVHFASIDVSFISLKLILPALMQVLLPPYTIIALIKPQFEAGRGSVGKKGVVRDQAVHVSVIEDIINFAKNSGLCVCGLDYSPIKGPGGNIEYLICLRDSGASVEYDVEKIVLRSHESAE